MVILVVRRHTLKRFMYLTLLLCLALCTYYVYYVHKTRPFSHKLFFGPEAERLFLRNHTYFKNCPPLVKSRADIDTNEVFQTLELESVPRLLWDKTLDRRYRKLRQRQSTLPVKVILVPHSHNDPGWLETYIYYYNTRTAKILNNIIEKLEEYKNITFLWPEVVFLETWWESASPDKRKAMKSLVQSGRLEIVTGGWVMPDEATTHMYALIDQLIEGHQWIYTNLEVKPKYGWSVDAFGHSSTQAYILALSKIEATVIQRIHHAWKKWLAYKRCGDFVWVPNWNSNSENTGILTHNQPFWLYTTAACGPNEYICSEFKFGMENEDYLTFLDVNNTESLVIQLLQQYAMTASLYEHNVVLAPLGCDFCFKDPRDLDIMYQSYDKIIKFANERYKNHIEIKYGTVKTYFEEIAKRNIKFPILKGDFFVYADRFPDDTPAYWSGYFTTRPYFKILGRSLEAKLRSAEILYAMALYSFRRYGFEQFDTFKKDFGRLIRSRRALALFQHHDSITGTSKSFVMKDNAMKLLEAITILSDIQRRSVSALFSWDLVPAQISNEYVWSDLERLKETLFQISEGIAKTIIFFNPLAQRRIQFVKILTNNINTKIRDHITRTAIAFQISPMWEYFQHGSKIFISPNKFEMSFFINLPAMSLKVCDLYHDTLPSVDLPLIYSNTNLSEKQLHFNLEDILGNTIRLENQKYIVRFNASSGLLKSIFQKRFKRSLRCFTEILAYNSATYWSGAYVFQPEFNIPGQKGFLEIYKPIIHVVIGRIYSQLTAVYGHLLVISVRLYNSTSYLSDAIYIETAIDFDISDSELFMRFTTDIENSDPPIIFTDSNGLHMQKRTYTPNARVPGNYFPITTMAYIEDNQKRLSLLTNHAQGAASLETGLLEIMLDRRIINDDNKGLGEGVVDNTRIVCEFWLLPEYFKRTYQITEDDKVSRPSLLAHHLSNSLNYPISMFSLAQPDAYQRVGPLSLLRECFPCDVHVVNFRVQARSKFADMFSKNAFLILYRQAYSCDLKSTYRCFNNDFKDNCGFDTLKVAQILPMSLTGLETQGASFTNFKDIILPPMVIQTYNITFL